MARPKKSSSTKLKRPKPMPRKPGYSKSTRTYGNGGKLK